MAEKISVNDIDGLDEILRAGFSRLIDHMKAGIGSGGESGGTGAAPTKIPVTTNGQVQFTVPAGATLLIVEGAGAMDYGVDYVINGTTLTWLSYTALDTTDVLYVF